MSQQTTTPADLSGEKTVDELRTSIARKTGHRPRYTLTRSILNSLHAYLTGEFYVKPGLDRITPREELLDAVVVAAINHDQYTTITPDDPEDHALVMTAPPAHGEFRRPELRELDALCRVADDAREWTP